ncbi:uncharacterized protein LOC110458492 isoform X2 [Mizuhopecten yessoensis]|uniref:uncharacterized protein LOC110458492 isoform X2 n=1 Tax=Mizuhopecten yessoensis TaxID=6573 RepID=UPI000B45A0D9|nr:uncharacterized protein LOC110458492 isoform X2 [Mizuhopecten yessoensis]
MAANTLEQINALLITASAKGELELLQKVHANLQSLSLKHSSPIQNPRDDVIEEEVILTINGRSQIFTDPLEFCGTQEALNKFTCYVFDRRFGWSEANSDGGGRVRRMSCTGTVLASSDGHHKAVIIELLDVFLKWYGQQDLYPSLTEAFKYTLKQVANMPVVRNRAVVHIMEWLKENRDSLVDCQFASSTLDLIKSALTDVWSAIRNACAKQLVHIVGHFKVADQGLLFNSLVKICKCENSLWQAKEGAIMGINAMILQCQDGANSRSQTPQFALETDSQSCGRQPVPEFVSRQIHTVVFSLLSNPQLTIRENAAKALSAFISSSDVKEALSTLEKVISVLWSEVSKSQVEKDQRNVQLPVKFLDAYAAEGTLDVCLFLVKVLPLPRLLPRWPQYLSTFLLYLSHPASTVRQAASNIFKYLVAKSSHSAVLVKLVLQALTEGWEPDLVALSREDKYGDVSSQCTRPSVSETTEGSILETWESREGRLFAYELIMKFLIKNHWLYTFGPAGSGAGLDWGDRPVGVDTDREMLTGLEQGQEIQKQNTNGHDLLERRNTQFVLSTSPQEPMRVSESELSFAVRFFTQDLSGESNEGKASDRLTGAVNGSVPAHTSKVTLKDTSPSQLDTIYSILMQVKVLETMKDTGKNHICTSHQRQLQTIERLFHSKDESAGHQMVESWLHKQQVSSLRSSLVNILHQTLECLSDSRWELRRMAQQVLPCLAEVIRWFDMSILEDLWKTHLQQKTSLFTYAAALLLKESVIHCVRLEPLLHKPPGSWQDHDGCKKIITSIVKSLTTQLNGYLSCLDNIIQRPVFDRLSVIAASTVITAHNHFSIHEDQRVKQTATVLSFWKLLFCFTHPNLRISKDLIHGNTDIKFFSSPFEGYLSCCLVRPDNKQQCAKQVEKLFITETFHACKHFLQSLPVESSSLLLPMVAHYTGIFVEDSHICKTLTECLSVVGSKVVGITMKMEDDEQQQSCLKCINLSLKELSAIITMKSSEVHLVQKVLNIYITLCQALNPVKHVRLILVAICSRVNEDIYFSAEHSPRPGDDLSLLSNNIPLSSSPVAAHHWDQEDTVISGSPGVFPECLTLDLSNNSGSLPSGRLSSLSQYSDKGRTRSPTHSVEAEEGEQEQQGSDWDSWDEEENEGSEALKEAFSEFLIKLQKICNSGSTDVFTSELNKLEYREKTLILDIMEG